MSDQPKGHATPKAPQNQKPPEPETGPAPVFSKTRALVGGLEAGVTIGNAGKPMCSAMFNCAGGHQVELIWPLEMTDAVCEGLLASKALYEQSEGGDLQVIENKIQLPPGVTG